MSKQKLGHIGVLMGGPSSEREISLKSGTAIFNALKDDGQRVSSIDIASQNEDQIFEQISHARIEVAFIALHGRLGEDGRIQSILESLKLPYTGSGPLASARALDKTVTQTLLRENNIPVARHLILRRGQTLSAEQLVECFQDKMIVVKPSSEGSSIGVQIVEGRDDLQAAVSEAYRFGPDIILEEYIDGREMTVGILGHEALDVIEIRSKSAFFDFSAKYQSVDTEYDVPANISPEMSGELRAIALKAYHILGCRHLGRVDFMVDAQEKPYVLEINTIPGFTKTSLLPKAAAVRGINFTQLCLRLLSMAYGE